MRNEDLMRTAADSVRRAVARGAFPYAAIVDDTLDCLDGEAVRLLTVLATENRSAIADLPGVTRQPW